MNTTVMGKRFEDATASIFKILNFEVEHDLVLASCQIDLRLTKYTGPIRENYIVECKDHAEKISIETMRSFHSTLICVKKDLPHTNGIFVSRVGFSKEAKAFAALAGIQTLTLAELSQQIISFEQYSRNLLKQYQETVLSNEYVPLDAYEGMDTIEHDFMHSNRPYVAFFQEYLKNSPAYMKLMRHRGYSKALSIAAAGNPQMASQHIGHVEWLLKNGDSLSRLVLLEEPEVELHPDTIHSQILYAPKYMEQSRRPVEDLVNIWLLRPNCSGLFLLGDYGTGKTSFIRYFAAKQAGKHTNDPAGVRSAVIIQLKNYPNGLSEQLLVSAVSSAIGCPHLTWDLLEHCMLSGRLLLLLDGFDEMGFQVDAQHRRAHFASLYRLLGLKNGKVIITGRPGYFPSASEMTEITTLLGGESTAQVSMLELAPFNAAQIDRFLNLIESRDPSLKQFNLKKFINTVYNLRDLASRPFLLHLIAKTIPEIKKTTSHITPAKLYELYTTRWIDREYAKGEFRWLIAKEQKRAFMIEIAWQMLLTGNLSIHFSALATWVAQYFKLDNQQSVDHFVHDIRTCSFLNRDAAGNYSFNHKSFMEYFVALGLVEAGKLGRPIDALLHNVPRGSLTRNSISFCIDMVADNIENYPAVLPNLVPPEYGPLAIMNAIGNLSKDTLAKVWSFIGGSSVYQKEFEPWSKISPTNDNRLGNPDYIHIPIVRKKRGKGKTRPPLLCCFCGIDPSKEIRLVKFPSNVICEACITDAKALFIVRKALSVEIQVSKNNCNMCGSKKFEERDSLKNHKGTLCVCSNCIDAATDNILKRQAVKKVYSGLDGSVLVSVERGGTHPFVPTSSLTAGNP